MDTVSLAAAGHDVHAVRWPGAGDGRAPMLLVHGLGGSCIEWDPVAPALAAATGREVVAVDLPGFGASRLGRGPATVAAYQTLVAALIDELGAAVLMGNSMGGLVALGVAASQPGLVPALVLVGPALSAGGFSLKTVRGALPFVVPLLPGVGPRVIAARRRRLGAERHVAERLRSIVREPDRVPSEVRARMVEQARERMAYAEAPRAYSAAARSIFTGASAAWRAVREVATPTLAIHGARDSLVPVALVDRLRVVRPDWRYEVIDDAGHLPHLELPGRFVKVVTAWVEEKVPTG